MRTLIIAELRAAWSSWLAVLIAFVVTSFAIVLAVLAIDSLQATNASGAIPDSEIAALVFLPAWNLALAIVGTLSVIGAVTGLVVQARRGALARLALAGATPAQVSRILLSPPTSPWSGLIPCCCWSVPAALSCSPCWLGCAKPGWQRRLRRSRRCGPSRARLSGAVRSSAGSPPCW